MLEIPNPHDLFFRETFSRPEVAQPFLAHALPTAIAETLDLTTLALQPETFIDDELQEYFSDLLFRVQATNKQIGYVYLLIEHKSFIARFTHLQLLRYMLEAWERVRQAKKKLKKLPFIFPLVVYQGRRKWIAPKRFRELIDAPDGWKPYIPDFAYHVVSVANIRESDLFGAVLLKAVLRVMKHILDPKLVDKLPKVLEELFDRIRREADEGFVYLILRYIVSANPSVTAEGMKMALENVSEEKGGNMLKTLAQQWLEQGWEQGLEQGARQELLASIKIGINAKFGEAGIELRNAMDQVQNLSVLRTVLAALFKTTSLQELENLYHEALTQAGPDNPARFN